MKIVYMGTPEFAVAPLQSLLESGYEVVGVITVPDKPKGRGLQMSQSDVKKYMCANYPNIPLLQPVSLRDPNFLEQLKSLNADLFIVVAFRMLPECVWQMPKLGTFNLHASLLPKYRGAAPINWAIINGERKSGVTTFFIDKEIDTGEIILQKEVEILPNETAGSLHDKLMEMGKSAVIETVKLIETNNYKRYSQEEILKKIIESENIMANVGSDVTDKKERNVFIAPKLNSENTTIKWSLTACEIDRLIRGLSPYPAAITKLVRNTSPATDDASNSSSEFSSLSTESSAFVEEIPFKIFGSSPLESSDIQKIMTLSELNCETLPCGHIVITKSRELFVKCSDGFLQITELQMSGKKRMRSSDFLLGFRDLEKYRFV